MPGHCQALCGLCEVMARGARARNPSRGAVHRAGTKLLCGGGGGGDTEAHFPTPPPLLGRRDGSGGAPDLPCRGGGGVNPTSMAQNDTHVALIVLTTQMWGGRIIGGKNFFGPNFVFLCLWSQHPFLHKTKGPTQNPISPTPPPSFGGRPCHPHPAEQFSGRPVKYDAGSPEFHN